jgi:hypothetical protein
MSATIQSVRLEELRSIEELSSVLESATASGVEMLLLLHGQRMVGTFVSPLAAKDMLARAVADRCTFHRI